ncbi:MAG: molybdate ABC transporter permease subunit [Gloeocapsa sp. DLM2.Bin57]|nr:MAG: molybdate ABC transporter permease subunit [Gloeocapsa sp. DLM2.Bin57]
MFNSDLSPLWISLRVSLLATIIALFFGTLVAYLMYKYQGRGKGLLDGIFTLPLVLPPTVVGFLLLLLLGRNSPVGKLLIAGGISVIFTWQGGAIAATVVAFPLIYKTILGAFEQIDVNLINAGRTLGANDYRLFWQILLPLAWRGVIAGIILGFARALGEFGATLMIAGNIRGRTRTIPIAIFSAAEGGDMLQALGWVLLMITIALVAIAIINYYAKSSSFSSPWSFWVGYWIMKRQGKIKQLLPSTKKGLLMNISKSLPGFQLKINLDHDNTPLGILGASGSGKSMTLKCLAGLEKPDQGRIVLNGKVFFDSERKINIPCHHRRLGIVFQNYALFPHLTVAQNIGFAIQDLAKSEREERIKNLIKLVELEGLEYRYPQQLSGGQQQRVALARALAIQPEALLFDEALSALDTYLRHQIEQTLIDVLASYHGASLFVTHKLEEAYRVCNQLVVFNHGKILQQGRKEDIFERPISSTVARVTECKNFSSAQQINNNTIKALDWDCELKVIDVIPPELTYVGIRAHHLQFREDNQHQNTFSCWLTNISETQHRISLYLKLHQPPEHHKDYHLQAEVYKQKWEELKNRPFPWYVCLNELKLFMMES